MPTSYMRGPVAWAAAPRAARLQRRSSRPGPHRIPCTVYAAQMRIDTTGIASEGRGGASDRRGPALTASGGRAAVRCGSAGQLGPKWFGAAPPARARNKLKARSASAACDKCSSSLCCRRT
eukprot:3693959-Prymnesium_polylepis.1